MDLHRIPDDLSIPKFLRREPRLPTPAEMDDMCGRAFMEAAKELREETERAWDAACHRMAPGHA